MAEKDKKYYWLKLQKDFFKRHDIRIVESMPNGKDYILFYLKLLCESIDHDGNLRFSEEIPYNEQMLATITNTNVDIVRSAVKLFTELKMMEILDDGTFYMSEVNKMLGSETYWAMKKREQRSLPESVGQCPTVSNKIPTSPSKSKRIDKDKDIDKDIDYIFAKFNEICKSLPKVKKLTDARKKTINARLEEYSKEDIIKAFEIAEKSDFLTGKKSDWSADFDWIMKPNNIVKVLEGNYANKGGNNYQLNQKRTPAWDKPAEIGTEVEPSQEDLAEFEKVYAKFMAGE